VGETEKRIAKAFRDAADDHALLMIDEVDSFLQDRKSAQYSWEKSQVNEMLTQIESFPGIFIASTNLMEGLDPAAMRRFDLKIQFGYLSADQAETLLQITLERYALPAATADQRSRLGEIPHLTPGDFANLDRQQRLTPFDSAEEVITALMHEVEHKSPASRPIGFIRHA
jgi:SpoVK/Ycf46/Vps4 family AAA+-type ATPase